MKRLFNALVAVCLMMVFASPDAFALPSNGAVVGQLAKESPSIDHVRVFCYNTYTGRFLHWGSCGYHYYHPVRHYPRVYCYNRYSGQFLHWGHC